MSNRAEQFETLPAEALERWAWFPGGSDEYFPGVVGIRLAEVRRDYCRLELPFRSALMQPAGIVHGGVTATMIDTVVVPAIGSGFDEPRMFATITMNVEYRSVVKPHEDMTAEGWVTQRGGSIVFTEAEVTAGGRIVATGSCIYKVGKPQIAP